MWYANSLDGTVSRTKPSYLALKLSSGLFSLLGNKDVKEVSDLNSLLFFFFFFEQNIV